MNKTESEVDCRFCAGVRPVVRVNGKPVCSGCGSHAANAKNRAKPKGKAVPKKCPVCNQKKIQPIDDCRFRCTGCGATFEEDNEPQFNSPGMARRNR